MDKRLLPLLVGLSISAAVFAQTTSLPTTSSTATRTTTTTTTTSWSTQPPNGAMSEEAIKSAIASAGYQKVKGLEFKDGVWRAKARGGNKKWAKLAVGPVSGKVYPSDAPSRLNEDEVSARLTAAGYQNVKDVKFDHGLWRAEAKSPHGHSVDLLADPDDGSVVAQSHG
ncbi:peptidase M4 [Rhodanobacter sp. C06]|uniref:PepSY domain-containing protein n=1 Tax=Rhodanobacter sp. C06 TaxID=1945854 RepID=UPI0009864146|nr:PepSY domain-containing protein [Rhodanobacter sp. C06]OOG37586.1 peptidase M4 [Rhodanobacter sp. C06]